MEEPIKEQNEVSEIEKEKNIEKETEELRKKLTEVLNLSEIEALIKSNEHVFEYGGVTYRVKRPNFKQKQEAYRKRIEKFTELLTNEKYLLENDLKKSYLKRGIDIDAIQQEMQTTINRRNNLMSSLGEALKNQAPDPDLKKIKEEIDVLNDKVQVLSIKKTSLLEFSIEQQLTIFVYSYLTFLLAEKKEGDNWVRLWNNWDEYENAP